MNDSVSATEAQIESAPDFRVFTATDAIPGVTFYFVESTAPENVEQRASEGGSSPYLKPIAADKAIEQIASKLLADQGESDEPADLVVMVHGFNNPRDNVIAFYRTAVEALQKDQDVIFGQGHRIVCIGYRWPSEGMFGRVLLSSFSAMPLFPLCLFGGSAVILILQLLGSNFPLFSFLPALALVLSGVILVLALLRAIVYFRDIYRATNHGVPDLVEVIRQIDREVSRCVDKEPVEIRERRQRIALSFIGHSMGGLVVTNAIRVLSDVFHPTAITTYLSGARREANVLGETQSLAKSSDERPIGTTPVTSKIGHVFTLHRFVLASPDIPAETLLADRANFLASSLRRFREAYLFSSEGDEVLRLISTTANYFSFPTRKRVFGYRLGNAEILSSGFGEIEPGNLLEKLRTGTRTLAFLSGATRRKNVPDDSTDPAGVAKAFSYFDCTDYVDGPDRKGLLTEALNCKANNPRGHLSYLEHIKLLWKYASPLVPPEKRINVHGGYFEGEVSQRLIYRLACLGFKEAVKAYGGQEKMLEECSDHNIRVILSSRLEFPERLMQREPIELSDTVRDLRARIDLLEAVIGNHPPSDVHLERTDE